MPDDQTQVAAAERQRLARAGRTTRHTALAIAATLAVGFAIVFSLRAHGSAELAAETATDAQAPPPVDVATVAPADTTAELTLPGQTAPWYGTTIYSRVDGYVAKWVSDIGDPVKAGQVLAKIETPELDAELEAARAKRNAAAADVQVREAEARFAESTYQRWKDSPKGVVSQQETEDKKAGHESADAKLVAARAQVSLAQSEVDRLKAFQTFKDVTAPFDGVITQRKIDIGNLVTAGSTASTTPLYQIAQNDPIRVFVDVPQSAAAAMKTGIAVDVVTTGSGSRTYRGQIARTAGAVDPKARTMNVEVDIANKDGSLVPGLYVDATFHLENGGVAEVPAAALSFRSKGPQVALLQGDRVKFQPVTIAQDNGATVSLASGVKRGVGVGRAAREIARALTRLTLIRLAALATFSRNAGEGKSPTFRYSFDGPCHAQTTTFRPCRLDASPARRLRRRAGLPGAEAGSARGLRFGQGHHRPRDKRDQMVGELPRSGADLAGRTRYCRQSRFPDRPRPAAGSAHHGGRRGRLGIARGRGQRGGRDRQWLGSDSRQAGPGTVLGR